MGSHDVAASGFAIRGGATERLELVLGSQTGSVQGVVRNNGQPAPGAAIMAVPAGDLTGRSDLFRPSSSGANGGFTLHGLAPGEYRLYAFGDEAAYDDDSLRQYEQFSKLIKVTAGKQISVDLPLIDTPAAAPE